MKLEFSRQIFQKFSDIKFHENPSSGSRVVSMRTNWRTDGWTDRHDEANSLFFFAIFRTRLNRMLTTLTPCWLSFSPSWSPDLNNTRRRVSIQRGVGPPNKSCSNTLSIHSPTQKSLQVFQTIKYEVKPPIPVQSNYKIHCGLFINVLKPGGKYVHRQV
jgi:hypothetical protein